MNSDARRVYGHRHYSQHSYAHQESHHDYYSPKELYNRLGNPSTLVPVVVLALTVLYQVVFQQGRLLHLLARLCDMVVYVIPARPLFAVDRLLDPPLFPRPMPRVQPHSHEEKKEVIRKMLGIDRPGSLLHSVSEAARWRGLGLGVGGFSGAALGTKAASDRPEPPGLGNLDNSCYQNSILQGLASLETLLPYLSAIPPSPDDGRSVSRARTVDALRDLLADLNDANNNGKTLWTPWALKKMNSWQQQDAQEYFSKLLDEIDKDVSRVVQQLRRSPSFDDARSDDTMASQHSDDSGYQSMSTAKPALDMLLNNRNPLEGLTAQRVACVSCGYCEGLSTNSFNCLTLNLGVGLSLANAQHDLAEQLDEYTRVEEIHGVECPKCSLLKAQHTIQQILAIKPDGYPELHTRLQAIQEALEDDAFDEKTLVEKCKISPQKRVSSTKTKQVVIARPPRSLAVHMNRSVFDERTGHLYKNLSPVQFPQQLDLGRWCLGSARARGDLAAAGGEGYDIKDEEQWHIQPRTSMVAGSMRPSRIRGPIYELRAVVTHFGAHENGHYVCYRRTRPPQVAKETGSAGKPPQLADEARAEHEEAVVSDEPTQSPVEEHEETVTPDETEVPDEAETETDAVSELDEAEESIADEEPRPQWWRISDQQVSAVDEAMVLGQGGVFMLFYDCIDPNSVVVADSDLSDAESVEESVATAIGGDFEGGERDITGENMEKAMSKLAIWGDVVSAASMVPLPDEDDGL